MKRWLYLSALLGALALPFQGLGAGLIIVDDGRGWPGPVPPPVWPPRPPHIMPPPRPHPFAPLEVRLVKVNTRINDQVASTTVDQEFFNPNPARLEGTFVLPLPKGAHIDKFTMEIDGKQVEAELLAADKARRIYEDIVRKLKDPALLEYAGRDIFKVRIFPIEPNSLKRIRISYTQLLKADDGLVGYVLPLSTEKFSAKPIRNVSVRIDLETRRPLKSVYSPTHTVEIKRDGSNRATIGYEGGESSPGTDLALYYATEKDEIGVNLLTHRLSGEDGYFLLLASPGMDVRKERVVHKDVAFVLDTSGSMAGKKLEQAKKALLFCIENLNPGDRFEIVRFSTEVECLFDKLVSAEASNLAKARTFIQDLKPIGGTAIDDALKKALSLRAESDRGASSSQAGRPFVIIFLTDGRPTIGTTDEDQIVAGVKHQNESRNRIFCFGIGTDVNTHLLDRITEETRAFSQYVLPEEDIEVKVSSFYAKIKEPVLTNPTLKFTGDLRVMKLYPSPLPDLFKGDQLVLVGRYSGQGDSAVILEGTVNSENRKFTYEVNFPAENRDGDFIPRLWATRRVGYLLDEIRLHGENAELRDETTELARKYGIVTPYTAYLILEDEARRNVPLAMQSFSVLNKDTDARREAAQNWSYFKGERAGEMAVAGARFGSELKLADAAAPAATRGSLEANRALGLSSAIPATPAEKGKARLANYAQQSQFVAGKTFYQNEGQWTDSAVQKQQNTQRVRVQFGSTNYFALLATKPEAAPWLALGQNVQFVLHNTIYEIYE